jgi:hypothetical protein
MLRPYRASFVILAILPLTLASSLAQESKREAARAEAGQEAQDAKKACEELIEKLRQERAQSPDPSSAQTIEDMIRRAEQRATTNTSGAAPVPLAETEIKATAEQAFQQLLARRAAANEYEKNAKAALGKGDVVAATSLLTRAKRMDDKIKEDLDTIGQPRISAFGLPGSGLPGRRIQIGHSKTLDLLIRMDAEGVTKQRQGFEGAKQAPLEDNRSKGAPPGAPMVSPPSAGPPQPKTAVIPPSSVTAVPTPKPGTPGTIPPTPATPQAARPPIGQPTMPVTRGGPQRHTSSVQDIRHYDRQHSVLTGPDGRKVSIERLVKAVSTVNPAAAKDPLVKVQPPVPGAAPVERFSPTFLRTVAERRDDLRKIGGVALDVTFEHLALAGIPDLRVPGPATFIENPVLISLKRLMDAAKPHAAAQDRWERLPDDIRYPGNIDRIRGFVLSPDDHDVLVIGTRAANDRDRIDIDTLILSMSIVWKQGLVPGVSLDPLPNNPSGPQYPRVINVPRDSLMAKIMLDADYEMKSIIFGNRRLNDPTFRSARALIEETRDFTEHSSRFWFYPRSLRQDTVRVSQSGRSVLFQAQLDVLTEDLLVDKLGLRGTGTTNKISQRVAELFTMILPKLELSDVPQPPGIYRQLHGVADAVTLCKLLRTLGIDYPILDSISRLPYRQLRGAIGVPAHYRGLVVPVSISGAPGSFFLMGGVDMRPRPSGESFDVYQDLITTNLELAADELRVKGGLYQQVSMSFLLPTQEGIADARMQPLLLKASRALETGKYDVAAQTYREILAAQPLDVDALLNLAVSESFLARHPEARRAITRARALASDDDRVRLIAVDIERRANPADIERFDPAILKSLSDEYVSRAYAAMHAARTQDASRFADEALAIWRENGDAYLLRYWLARDRDHQLASAEINKAIRIYRQQRGNHELANTAQPRLAIALSLSASLKLDRLKARIAKIQATGAQVFEARTFLDDTRRAAEEAQEAAALDPSLGLALSMEVLARTVRLAVMRENKQIFERDGIALYDPAPTKALADDAVRRFPDFPLAYVSRAILSITLDDYSSAERDLSSAISQDPTLGEAFLERALLQAKRGQCAHARNDLQRAKALKVTVLSTDEREINRCR